MNNETPTRTRTNSNASQSSDFSDDNKNHKKYENMTFEEIIQSVNVSIEVFENTRSFNPRKQRSCHKRAEPVSEKKRKEESSKNSREYTKRNRDEIKLCRELYSEKYAIQTRIQELVAGYRSDKQERKVLCAIGDFEIMMADSLQDVTDVRKEFNVPHPDEYLNEYRENVEKAEKLRFETPPVSYEEKYAALREEYEELQSKKDNLMSQKEKTNYASSKSRLKQRMIRAELKTECYNCWVKIETLKLQGAELKKQSELLKKNVWENILAVYYNFLKHLKSVRSDPSKLQTIELYVREFAPFSRSNGEFSMRWVPKAEEERPQQLIGSYVDVKEELLDTSVEQKVTPTLQDTNISTTSPLIQNGEVNSPTMDLASSLLSLNSLTPPVPQTLMAALAALPIERKPQAVIPPVVNVSADGIHSQQIWPEPEAEETKDSIISTLLEATTKREVETPSRKRTMTPEQQPAAKMPYRPAVNQGPRPVYPTMVPLNFMPQPGQFVMNPAMFGRMPPPQIAFPAMNLNQMIETFSTMSPQLREAVEHQKMIQNLLVGAFSSNNN